MEVKINREIRNYTESMFFGLSLRQFIFSVLACGVAVGDIIFFDWEGDGTTDHVGIVEKCENGTVYTVEGNSGDACKQRQYAVGSSNIYGYGIPAY